MTPLTGVNSIRSTGKLFPDVMLLAGGNGRGLKGQSMYCLELLNPWVCKTPPISFWECWSELVAQYLVEVPQDFWHLSHCAPSGSYSNTQSQERPCGMRVAIHKAPETKTWVELIKKEEESCWCGFVGWSVVLSTESLHVQFLVRAHWCVLSHIDVFLSLSLSFSPLCPVLSKNQ